MKNYNVTIGESNFTIIANNKKEAAKKANFHKRMEKLKGVTTIYLAK